MIKNAAKVGVYFIVKQGFCHLLALPVFNVSPANTSQHPAPLTYP
jgi:hypothetical protein